MGYTVQFDFRQRVLNQRIPIAHSHVDSGLDSPRAKRGPERLRLLVRYLSKRRPSPYLLVIAARFPGPLGCNQPRKRLLKRLPGQPNNVGVREKSVKEREHLVQRFRAAKIE